MLIYIYLDQVGENYLEEKRFINEGIKLVYSTYSLEPYKQMPIIKILYQG